MMVRLAAAALLAAASLAHAGEAQLKPWRGKSTLELAASSLEGAKVDLRDYRGRVVIVNFWATWCEPCREEMPSLERLRDKLAGRPFAVLAVNYGESREKVAKFLEHEMVSLPVVLDTQKEVARDWDVGGLPMTFVVDARGRVRYSVFGGRDWSDAGVRGLVERLMAEGPHA